MFKIIGNRKKKLIGVSILGVIDGLVGWRRIFIDNYVYVYVC